MNFVDFKDEELINALHFLDGHSDVFEGREAVCWNNIRRLIVRTAEELKALESEIVVDKLIIT